MSLLDLTGKRVLSGVKPTGSPTLGNYLGAIQNFVRVQDRGARCFLFIADLHALTEPQDPDELRQLTYEVAMIYLAAGLDPTRSTIFAQSHVPAHAELGWIMTCLSYMGELHRMTQFKEKAESRESVSAGLFTYPALMAADILLYQADFVPVGDDQKQHLELTRDLAQRFNQRYGETFRVPEPMIAEVGARIMGLDDPNKKMSKTAASQWNYVLMLEDDDAVRQKFARAVTDSGREVRLDWEHKPGVSNLLEILSLVSGRPIPELEQAYEGKGYGAFKRDVAEAVVEVLRPIRARYREMDLDRETVRAILREGAERAAQEANRTLEAVKDRLGLVRP